MRNELFGITNTVIRVPCNRFKTLLDIYGISYYLKIDIEGSDILCLEALKEYEERPRYIAIEADVSSFEGAFAELSTLWSLGYRQFKIINQALNHKVKCPNPPLEGKYVDYDFDGFCSGPFGEETLGPWMSVEKTLLEYKFILMEQKYFGDGKKLTGTMFYKLYSLVRRVGWYDLHAKLAN